MIAASIIYLVINFGGGYYNAAAATIPMKTEDACLRAAKIMSAKHGVFEAYCINPDTGEAFKP